MEEVEIWNKLAELNAALAYQLWLEYVFIDPITRSHLSREQIYDKIGFKSTKFYEQRNEIFDTLETRDITDLHIRVLDDMVGDNPKLLRDPPRFADWPPAKKELHEEPVTQLEQPLPDDSKEDEKPEEPEEGQDPEIQALFAGQQAEIDQGNGNGEPPPQEQGLTPRQLIAGLIIFALIIAVTVAVTLWAVRQINRGPVPEAIGVELPTDEPTEMPAPPTEDLTVVAASVQETVVAAFTLTAEAMPPLPPTEPPTQEPTVDTGATVDAAIQATADMLTAQASTDGPSPPPDTPTPTPGPMLALPFEDRFESEYSDAWEVIEGEILLNDGGLRAVGDEIVVGIGPGLPSDFVAEFDFRNGTITHYIVQLSPDLRFRGATNGAISSSWQRLNENVWEDITGAGQIGTSGHLKFTKSGSNYRIDRNGEYFSDVTYGEPTDSNLIFTLNGASTIDNVEIYTP